ncbi:MAG: hypothetical protein AB8B82_09675 [Roseovarius sp.]
MLRTIKLGKYISVQGICVRTLPNGQIQVRDGDKLYSGDPVTKAA